MSLWGSIAVLFCCLAVFATEPALEPVSVCDALDHLPDFQGKAVALVGRYSFRKEGRWLDQEACGGNGKRGMVWLTLDSKSAPKPPESVSINEVTLERILAAMKQHTSLGKFRFGSPDYDRWAVMFGRLETGSDQKTQLVYRGDGAIFYFVDK
jgi:hypothetical protein